MHAGASRPKGTGTVFNQLRLPNYSTKTDLLCALSVGDVLITDVFRGPYDDNLYEPIALRTLNLAHNELHTIGKNVFEHLLELRSLDLSGNRFRVIDQLTYLSFQKLPKLEVILNTK